MSACPSLLCVTSRCIRLKTLPALLVLLAGAAGSSPMAAQSVRPPLTGLTGVGVSRELAEARRQSLDDVRYALSLRVSTSDTASGEVQVQFTTRGQVNAADDVILDFRGLFVDGGEVNGQTWNAREAWNGHHLVVPSRLLQAGRNTLRLRFGAPVASAGAAIIRTQDVRDSSTYLYTLLVPADANLLFPVFDQPDLKARVRLSLTTPLTWRALSNGALVSRDSTASEAVHHFAETAPISTYLLAFAAGPWQVQTRELALADGAPAQAMSLWVRRSRAAEAESDTLLHMNARALRWLGQYFAVPYPFGKYDLLLAPAFPFGGMEHPGAVFYNEESFIYREPPTVSQLLGRQATTFHEVAHQWFGDYVTMRWFDDLWLKEGFATFMAARMQAALQPEANAWKTFYLRNKPVAYATDVTAGTTPVWQALGNLDQAKSNYGPIVYNKAPSLLRQLEYVVGEEAFRRGVQQFLRQHAFGNATWQELLAAIGAAAGRDLSAWGRQWMLRPGVPVISQHVRVERGRIASLRLTQRPAQPSLSGTEAWPLKLELRLHYVDRAPVLLSVDVHTRDTEVTAAKGLAAPAFVYANDGDYGYAVVLPDSASVAWLTQELPSVRDELLRAQLWGALWDLVRDAQLDPRRYVAAVLRGLPLERDEQIAASLVARAVTASQRYVPAAARDSLAAQLRATLRAGAQDARLPYGQRKAQFDAWVSLARDAASLDSLRHWVARDSVWGLPLRAPTQWSLVQQLVARGAADHATLIADMRRRDATSEGARQAFVADAARPDSANKAAVFARWFGDATLNEEWVTSSLRTFFDGEHATLTMRYVEPALDTLPWIQQNRRIFFLGSWLAAVMGSQRSPEALRVVDAWLAAQPGLAPDLRQKLLQARDELERTVRILGSEWNISTAR